MSAGQAGADCVCVDLDACGDERLRQCADVLYGTDGGRDAAGLLLRYPGCLCVTLRGTDTCTAVARDGPHTAPPVGMAGMVRVVRVVLPTGPGELSPSEHALVAEVLHAWLVRRLPLAGFARALSHRSVSSRGASASRRLRTLSASLGLRGP